MKHTFLGLRVILAGVFLYAGLVKAPASAQFAVALAPFTFLPDTWIRPLALALPLIEITAAILLLVPYTKRIGAGIVLALCVAFISALTWALANNIIVSCSCFGPDEIPSAGKMRVAVLRDVLLAVLAGAVMLEKPLLRRLWRTRDNSRKTPGSASN